MTHKKVRIGILGCANIAKKYVINAFQSIGIAEVLSIADRDYEKAKICGEEFKIVAKNSFEEIIHSSDIDAVYIPQPIGLHKKWVLESAKNKKHILCEKSLAENFSSITEMVVSCKKNGVILYENFMCDFHPQHKKVISLIKENRIGKPFLFRGNFGFPPMNKDNFRYDKSLGGGSLNDAGAYTVFMARKIFESEPISVFANLIEDEKMGVDMKGVALLDFPEEKEATVGFSFDAVYQNNYSIWGNTGLIHVERAYSIPPNMKPEITLTTNKDMREKVENIEIDPANHFELLLEDFCRTVLHIKEEGDKIEKIFSSIIAQGKVMEAIRISSKEKRGVKISEII